MAPGDGSTSTGVEIKGKEGKEKAAGLAEIAKKILYGFFLTEKFQAYIPKILAIYNKIERNKITHNEQITQKEKEEALAVLSQEFNESSEFTLAPDKVAKNYFAKIRSQIEQTEVVEV